MCRNPEWPERTGLHCTRPECRKRRKERLRKAWLERKETRRSWTDLWPVLTVVGPLRTNLVIQDDRWRGEAEARAMRYASVRRREFLAFTDATFAGPHECMVSGIGMLGTHVGGYK
jgi:hypothetical protein